MILGRPKSVLGPTLAIAAREFGAVFRTPVGWVIAALYALLTAVTFCLGTLAPGQPASMRYFFGPAGFLLITVAPAISMRTISEELRSGSIELVRAAPIGDGSLVLGKFAGSLAALAAIFVPTLAFPAALFILSSPLPDPGPIVTGYLGVLLLGSLYLALGIALSACTHSQTLAYVGTLLLLLLLQIGTAPGVASRLGPDLAEIVINLSPSARAAGLAKGVVDLGDVAYFVAASAACLAVAAARLSWRRWA